MILPEPGDFSKEILKRLGLIDNTEGSAFPILQVAIFSVQSLACMNSSRKYKAAHESIKERIIFIPGPDFLSTTLGGAYYQARRGSIMVWGCTTP